MNKPLILTDNLFDNVVLHPSFVLQVSDQVNPPSVFDTTAGHEAFRVADNLRDLTSCTVSGTNVSRVFGVDCQAAVSPNIVILDRGHNLNGVTVYVQAYDSAALAGGVNIATPVIPSTPGGLPSDANGCLTPDGVWWKTFSPSAKRFWAVTPQAMGVGVSPIITGIYMGVSYRFSEYLNAPGAYDFGTAVKYMSNQDSRGGVRVKSRPINRDRLSLSIDVDSTDYAALDVEMRRVLRYNCPMWFAFDDADSTGAGQPRLFQLAGDTVYDPRVNPVHREIRVDFEELIPTLFA